VVAEVVAERPQKGPPREQQRRAAVLRLIQAGRTTVDDRWVWRSLIV
jgi:hypothetical protein